LCSTLGFPNSLKMIIFPDLEARHGEPFCNVRRSFKKGKTFIDLRLRVEGQEGRRLPTRKGAYWVSSSQFSSFALSSSCQLKVKRFYDLVFLPHTPSLSASNNFRSSFRSVSCVSVCHKAEHC